MFLREKIKLAVPGELSGSRCLSALKDSWKRLRSKEVASEDRLALARFFDRQASAPELSRLVETLRNIRTRILANAFIGSCAKWLVWLLVALIGVASISTRLAGALIFIAVAAAFGVAAILGWTWRNRPSSYETARRLDFAAGLKDRISTAIYLGREESGDGIVGEQRRDALARAGKIDGSGLFPLHLPGNYRSAFALVLVASALFAYRIHHRPPLLALLQNTAHSQFVQSIISPMAHAVEKDLQRTMALLTKPDATGEETQRPDAASNTEDLWKANDDKSANADDPKNPADPGEGDQQQDQMQAGNQAGDPNGDARQEDSYSQSQEGKSGNENASDKGGEQSEQQGPEGRQSLGQSLMQALKNMMSNSPNQQSNNRAGQQPPNGQGTPQSGNSRQPGATDSDKKGESRGNSDAKQKATQTASEGAGSQQGTKELRKDQETHPVNAVPDRVALEASGFKDDTRMKVPTETGVAQLGTQNVTPQQDAVINGAEQENIPARYRFYVQRYFEHADNGKQ